jgi:hypothetical protein
VKEKLSKGKEKQPNDVMADILGLANSKKSIAMESEYTSKEVAEILGYRTSLSADT